ncbi:MAG: hypothetical protein KDA72_17360 [Planctomycetales bacterium]|nr:hypothetical protein [Planctomycetales bacterium]
MSRTFVDGDVVEAYGLPRAALGNLPPNVCSKIMAGLGLRASEELERVDRNDQY